MLKKGLSLGLAIVLACVLVIGCAPTPPEEGVTPAAPTVLKIGTGPVGGYWFPGGAVLAQIINMYVEGVNASPTLGGGVANIKDINAAKMQIGYTYGFSAADAMVPRLPFEEKQGNIRALTNMYMTPFQILVVRAKNINTLEDLKGKNYSAGPEGFSGKIIADRILEEVGMTYDDLGSVSFVGYSDGALAMKDGHLDCYPCITAAPSAAFLDTATTLPLDLLQLDPEFMKMYEEKYGMGEWTIPADTYPGSKETVCLASSAMFIISKDLPEDLVYEITKAFWEHYTDFHKVQKALEEQTIPENALKGFAIPLHKGAYKYYKEQGYEIPAALMPVD